MALNTIAEIRAMSLAALDSFELAYAAQIVGESIEIATTQATGLTADQNRLARYYLAVYNNTPDETVAVKGGKSGADYSQERDRLDTARLLRKLLNLPSLPLDQLQNIASRVRAYQGDGALDPFSGSNNGGASQVNIPTCTTF